MHCTIYILFCDNKVAIKGGFNDDKKTCILFHERRCVRTTIRTTTRPQNTPQIHATHYSHDIPIIFFSFCRPLSLSVSSSLAVAQRGQKTFYLRLNFIVANLFVYFFFSSAFARQNRKEGETKMQFFRLIRYSKRSFCFLFLFDVFVVRLVKWVFCPTLPMPFSQATLSTNFRMFYVSITYKTLPAWLGHYIFASILKCNLPITTNKCSD